MKNLVIIGAGGYGRVIFGYAKKMSGYNKDFVVKGFIDDNPNALSGYTNYPSIISNVKDYTPDTNDVFACAIGDVTTKRQLIYDILKKGGRFMSIIHPSSHISTNVEIGEGCIIGINTILDSDVKIGDYNSIQANTIIGHDTKIGNYCMIDCQVFTGGFCQIGNNVVLHTSSLITPYLIIGDNATVNAGSVVIRNVKDGGTVMGNPAKDLLIPKK